MRIILLALLLTGCTRAPVVIPLKGQNLPIRDRPDTGRRDTHRMVQQMKTRTDRLTILLQKMRDDGWWVAAHNDYHLAGRMMTFWLFTHTQRGRFVKGEGETDAEAVLECVDQVLHE